MGVQISPWITIAAYLRHSHSRFKIKSNNIFHVDKKNISTDHLNTGSNVIKRYSSDTNDWWTQRMGLKAIINLH